jgi:hypothetical protein
MLAEMSYYRVAGQAGEEESAKEIAEWGGSGTAIVRSSQNPKGQQHAGMGGKFGAREKWDLYCILTPDERT